MKAKILILLLLIPQLASAYYVRRPCCAPLQACGWWGNAEYMLLWRKHRFYPPLVTTNPTIAPIIGAPGTTILFGDEYLHSPRKNGFRGDFGIWISRCIAIGLSAYAVDEDEHTFSLNGNGVGNPIFGQPFINIPGEVPSVNLLSFPALQLNGHIDIETNNRIWGFDLFAGYRFLNICNFKFDLLGGFLYNSLNDNISVNSSTTSVLGPLTTKVADTIAAHNQFYAGMVGFIADWRSCSWGVNVVGKVGVGSMNKEVRLTGETTFLDSTGTVLATAPSGFLVQPSNSGTFTHNKWEAVSQISANLQLKIWQHIWATVGYTYIYWQAVDLAGEQIDLHINPNQDLFGPPSPMYHEHSSNFWMHGLTAGLYFCY